MFEDYNFFYIPEETDFDWLTDIIRYALMSKYSYEVVPVLSAALDFQITVPKYYFKGLYSLQQQNNQNQQRLSKYEQQ